MQKFTIESGKNGEIKTDCYYHIWNGEKDAILYALQPFMTRTCKGKRKQRENDISIKIPCVQMNKHKSYYVLPCALDCETTNYGERAYTWLIQFAIGKVCFLFNESFKFWAFLDMLTEILEPPTGRKLLIFDVNLGFEFQNVLFGNLVINDIEYDSFFKEKREPINITHDSIFEFKEVISWGGSLQNLAKNYTKTQKLKGDLDYTIIRNYDSLANLNKKELAYCISDVIILTEFWEWFYNKYLNHRFNPVTIQSAIRHDFEIEFKKEYPNRDVKKFKELQSKKAPKTRDEYIILMNGVYRGGYTHTDASCVGLEFTTDDGLMGADITSSYPWAMVCGYVPDVFEYVGKMSNEEFEKMRKRKCLYFRATFNNIRSKGCQSLESSNKCKCVNATLDNGRIFKADKLTTWITEIDYLNYLDFYEWDGDPIIERVYMARRQKLPRWFINVVIDNYVLKSKLKLQHLKYDYEKSIVNSCYGCMCTALNFSSLRFDGSSFSEEIKAYEEINHSNMLLPQWGVWVTCHSRRKVLALTYDLWKLEAVGNYHPHRVAYIDTDSVKVLNTNKAVFDVIKKANEENDTQIKKALDYYKKPYEFIVSDVDGETLGAWDIEYPHIDLAKFLGAKRYMLSFYDYKTNDYVTKSTIAGMPKGLLTKHCDAENIDYYDFFSNKMEIKNCKIRSVYNDEPHEDIINGCKMRQMSSLALVNTDFTMSITKDFIELVNELMYQFNTQEFKNKHKFLI